MPRSRESEGPQRQSPRRGPIHLRTSNSDPNSTHQRLITDRSPKLGDRQSPRGAQSQPTLSQKKLGTRIADLESQLGQAQVELRNLKGQLANAEAAKKEAQEQLDKKTKKPKARDPIKVEEKHSPDAVEVPNKKEDKKPGEVPEDNHQETDVFEVPMEKVTLEDSKAEISEIIDPEIDETKPTSESAEPSSELKKPSSDDLALKDGEINLLKAKLEEKDKELEASRLENESLKAKLNEVALAKSTSEAKHEEMKSKLAQLGSEVEKSKASETELKKKLEGAEIAKDGLEVEMKKMKVQTEQWRKAADAAAAVLAGDVEMNGRRVSDRSGSMDKHTDNMFDPSSVGRYNGYVGSPGFGDDSDDGFGGGKRKSSGIRMFGDLWKKKGQK